MSLIWKDFWKSYRNLEASNEDDLFVQVGKTIDKKPIAGEIFKEMIQRIIGALNLSPDDHLVDFCCGNGLVTYELVASVNQVTGVDFAEHLIRAAHQLKSHPRISYHMGDITQPLTAFMGSAEKPNKFLMNDALGCLDPSTLQKLLENILAHLDGSPFQFLITGIPNVYLKWNFYDTPERRARHLENEKQPDNINDGLGRWWSAEEIQELSQKLGLRVHLKNQPLHISNYRMDALISGSTEA